MIVKDHTERYRHPSWNYFSSKYQSWFYWEPKNQILIYSPFWSLSTMWCWLLWWRRFQIKLMNAMIWERGPMLRQPGQHLLNEFNQSVKWADLATSATNNMVTCNFSGITFAMQRLSLSDFITSRPPCGAQWEAHFFTTIDSTGLHSFCPTIEKKCSFLLGLLSTVVSFHTSWTAESNLVTGLRGSACWETTTEAAFQDFLAAEISRAG